MQADIKPLTALRFFAALWVVAYHYWPDLTPVRPLIVARGYLGVELFFVLSGFILCHVYLEAQGAGFFRYGDFLWARLARIYPLHLATLGAIAFMGAVAVSLGFSITHPVLAWSALAPNLLLVQAWGMTNVSGWNHPSWSVSAEWFAYVTFPAFAWAAWRLRRRPRVALVGVLLVSTALYGAFERLAGFPLTQATIAWGALRVVPCFASGCATYLLWRSGAVELRRDAKVGAIGFAILIVLAVLLGLPDVFLIALFSGLILSLAGLTSTGSRVLTSPLLVYLGEVSFAVYMVCFPWELAFTNGLQRLLHLQGDVLPLPFWMLLFGGVLPVAMAAHHLVERPARVWLRAHAPVSRTSRSDSLSRQAGPSTAAAGGRTVAHRVA